MAGDYFLILEKPSIKDGTGKVVALGAGNLAGETLDEYYMDKGGIEILNFSIEGAFDPSRLSSSGFVENDSPTTVHTFDNTRLTLTVTKQLDRVSPNLFAVYCENFRIQTGNYIRFSTARLVARKFSPLGVPQVFFELNFNNVYLSEISWDGPPGDNDVPTETVTFRFRSVTFAYSKQNQDGTFAASIGGGWDFKANSSLPAPPIAGTG